MRDVVSVCPVCNKPVHLGMLFRTSRWFWLHDDFYKLLTGENPLPLGDGMKSALLHADVNGALNILRKSSVVSLQTLYSRGEVDTPIRIRIA